VATGVVLPWANLAPPSPKGGKESRARRWTKYFAVINQGRLSLHFSKKDFEKVGFHPSTGQVVIGVVKKILWGIPKRRERNLPWSSTSAALRHGAPWHCVVLTPAMLLGSLRASFPPPLPAAPPTLLVLIARSALLAARGQTRLEEHPRRGYVIEFGNDMEKCDPCDFKAHDGAGVGQLTNDGGGGGGRMVLHGPSEELDDWVRALAPEAFEGASPSWPSRRWCRELEGVGGKEVIGLRC
jgi:hypothetical protein